MNPSLLYSAVQNVIKKSGQLRYMHKATFVTASGNVDAMSVVEKYSVSDYATGFCEEVSLRVAMSVYNYRRYLYTNRDNLRVIVQKIPIDPVSDTPLPQGISETSVYRGFLIDNEDPAITRGSPITSGTFVDGKDDMRYFSVQLVDAVAEYASVREGGAAFRFTKTEDILKSFILASIKTEQGAASVMLKGLDVVPPDVSEATKIDQVLIPHHTRLIDVPGFLQEEKGGLYNHGCGSFILNGIWYVYPLYNTARFKTASKRMVIYQVSTNMVPVADKTYTWDGATLTVVCSGSAKIQDISVSGQFEGGTGVRFVRASNFLNESSTNADNQGQINRSQNMAEFQTIERSDGFNIGRFSDRRVTDNVPNELSKIAARSGQVMVTTWQNSDTSLITPGMPVRVYQDIGGKITARDGTIIQVDEQSALERPGLNGKTMTTTAGLVIFLSKEEV